MKRPVQVWDILPWLCGIPAPQRYRQLIMAMQVFIDDSGKDMPPLYVLAGYVARAEQWAAFADEWQAALDLEPRLGYFKMFEAALLQGEFAGFTEAQRDDRLRLLAAIIKKSVLVGVSSEVNPDEYSSVFAGKINPFMDRAYLFLYIYVMYSAFNWQISENINEPMDFIYDDQIHDKDIITNQFLGTLDTLPEPFRSRIGHRPVYGNDKTDLPLQAADMLAWHFRREAAHPSIAPRDISAAAPILESIPHFKTPLPKEDLEERLVWMMKTNAETPGMFPYELKDIVENGDLFTHILNIKKIDGAVVGAEIEIVSIPTSETKRYLLVHSCPQCSNPHLHRRSSDECLRAAPGAGVDP